MAKKIFTLLLLVFTIPAVAEEERPWWKFWPSEEQQAAVEETSVVIADKLFTADERSILNEYLSKGNVNKRHEDDDNHGKKDKKAKKQKALPPGLQKKVERGGELPPGWQKKIARGEVLDDDLYLASKGLPQDILDQLPSEPEGTIIRQIDDTIVRVIEATDVILDVLQGNVVE